MELEAGAEVPSFEAIDGFGDTWRVPEVLEEGRPLLLVFLRHLGCPLCRERIDQLKRNHEAYVQAGVALLVVTQSSEKRVASFVQKQAIPYAVVGDREKRLYDLFGVVRGGLGAFLSPAAGLAGARATLKGYFHGRFEGDELQKPAEFIVGTDGRIAFSHYGRDISDFTPDAKLLARLAGLA